MRRSLRYDVGRKCMIINCRAWKVSVVRVRDPQHHGKYPLCVLGIRSA